MSRALPVLVLAFALTGCQTFMIQPQDSDTLKVAKFSARVPLALASFGISEGFYYCARSTHSPLPAWSDAQWAPLTPQERTLACEIALTEALFKAEPSSYLPAYIPPEPKKRNKHKRAYRKAHKQHKQHKQHKRSGKMHRHANPHHRQHKSLPKHHR